MTVPTFDEVTKFTPERSLVVIKKKNAGRNSYGRITVRHRGGGNKQKYRIIDFKRDVDKKATVVGIEYDPNRTAYIALLQDDEGKKSYIIAPLGVTDGDVLYTGADADIKPGNTLPIANIPSVRLSTTSSFIPDAALSSSAPQDPRLSLWLRKARWLRFVCPPAKSVTSVWTAALPSVRSATSSTTPLRSVRQVRPVTRVSVLQFAVPL